MKACQVGDLGEPAAVMRLGLFADQTIFIDDAEPHVLGTRALGLSAIQHTDPAFTRAALAELVPAPTHVGVNP